MMPGELNFARHSVGELDARNLSNPLIPLGSPVRRASFWQPRPPHPPPPARQFATLYISGVLANWGAGSVFIGELWSTLPYAVQAGIVVALADLDDSAFDAVGQKSPSLFTSYSLAHRQALRTLLT